MGQLVTNSIQTNIKSSTSRKAETLSNDNEKAKENSLKRIRSPTNDKISNIMEKRKRLSLDQDVSKVINKSAPGLCSVYVPKVRLVKSDYSTQPNKKLTQKMQLIVKEKKKISYVSHDVFPLFISLCVQKCPENDKKDMDKIIDKLKRHYETLDPIYARSENFVKFLNEKREAISSDNKKLYVHIKEVMNEMKMRKSKKKSKTSENNQFYDAVPSTSYANDVTINNKVESNDDDYDDNEDNASPETRMRIKQVLRAMKKCEARIKKLEEEEVDFEEENNSNYIKVERYKQRVVELYNKFCELTGENADAGRAYLRPKHLNGTGIVAVDQAITNFINSKITRRNQLKKTGNLTDDLIFPDYRDILACVNRCNERKNLGLTKERRKKMGKIDGIDLSLFIFLYLQCYFYVCNIFCVFTYYIYLLYIIDTLQQRKLSKNLENICNAQGALITGTPFLYILRM